jgi:hypothetical protein
MSIAYAQHYAPQSTIYCSPGHSACVDPGAPPQCTGCHKPLPSPGGPPISLPIQRCGFPLTMCPAPSVAQAVRVNLNNGSATLLPPSGMDTSGTPTATMDASYNVTVNYPTASFMANVFSSQTDSGSGADFATTLGASYTDQDENTTNPTITIGTNALCTNPTVRSTTLYVNGTSYPVTYNQLHPVVFKFPFIGNLQFDGQVYLDGQTIVLGIQDYGGDSSQITCGYAGQTPDTTGSVCRVDLLSSRYSVGSPYFPQPGTNALAVTPLSSFFWWGGSNMFTYFTDYRPSAWQN